MNIFKVAQAVVVSLIGAYLVIMISPSAARGEWYAGGYGGTSFSGGLNEVTMPRFGDQQVYGLYPGTNPNSATATFTQTFKASDIDLNASSIFGGKAGYFFSEEGLSWLGVEVEGFISKPNIKTQTLSTHHDIYYTPNTNVLPCGPLGTGNCPEARSINGSLQLSESTLRVYTAAFNVIARYPGKVFQPYAGVGAGLFYFKSSGGTIQGRQWTPGLNALAGVKLLVTDEWGLFVEGKYNFANISGFDQTYGLSGTYSIFHFVGGIAYHF